jgi:hypothetical protein
MANSHTDGDTAFPYVAHLNILFPALEKIDLEALAATVEDRWYNHRRYAR